MLSLSCPASSPSWSPTSPQLRFCCRCRQPSSSSAFPRVRFAPLPRRITLGGGGVVRSRNGSNPSTDSFAGWSETGTGGDEPSKKGGIGGSLGSGLAGLFFAAGVTFATLTLVNKNASVSKQQMEPLTREQEILIISDDTKRKDKLAGSEIHEVLPHEEIPTNNYKPNNITALQVPPGKALFPPLLNHVQAQAFAALQVLKVIDNDLQPGDICTRREYARWLVTASSVLSRTPAFKVYPSTYLENLTELAFDDVTLEDPDFKYIQGLAEAGIISSKLSLSDTNGPNSQLGCVYFYPDSPLSRQDLVSWKMALERVQLPEVDKNYLYQCTGYLDVDKINPDAWPAIIADFSAGEQGITALAFGYTRLFHPDKPVTKSQAAIALVTSIAAEVISEELARVDAESLAEAVVDSDTALVSEVEKDINASYEKELAMEKEKIEALEKLAEDARAELEKLRTQREEEKDELIRGRAAPEYEIGVLSTLRHEVEEQLQSLMSYKLEISYERERINKLRKEAENQNQVIAKLQYELEVERKALSLARSWAEEEAKKARAQARVLEEARERWEKRGLKIIVGEDLQDDALVGTTWLTAGEQAKIDETITSGETLVEKLKEMATEIKLRSSAVIERFIEKIIFFISILKQQVWDCSKNAMELMNSSISRVKSSVDSYVSRVKISKNEFQDNASSFGLVLKDKVSRIIVDCKEGVEKITQKFKR